MGTAVVAVAAAERRASEALAEPQVVAIEELVSLVKMGRSVSEAAAVAADVMAGAELAAVVAAVTTAAEAEVLAPTTVAAVPIIQEEAAGAGHRTSSQVPRTFICGEVGRMQRATDSLSLVGSE